MRMPASAAGTQSGLLRYGAAIFATAIAILVRYWLDPILHERQPFSSLYAAIAFAIWFSGIRGAILVAIVGGLAAELMFISPRGAIRIESLPDLVAVAAYVFSAIVIIVFADLAAKSAKRASEDRLRLKIAQTAASAGVFEWTLDERSATWSDDLRAIYGIDANYPSTLDAWTQLLHPEDRDRALQTLLKARQATSSDYENSYRVITPAGEVKHIHAKGKILFSAQGKPQRIVGLNLDVTAQRAMEHALLQSEKLAAAGRMAATVAHEINNPLQAVLGTLFLLRRDATISPAGAKLAQVAEEEVRRAATLAQRSLNLVTGSKPAAAVDLRPLTCEVADLYRGQAEARCVRVEVQVEADCVTACNPAEMKQVLSNLVLNSLDAMPQGGVLKIKGRARDQSVEVAVEDSGTGIPSKHLDRIFDPFFSTKHTGTGLGLWVSKSIVESIGGSLRVETDTSAERHGSRFILSLPAVRKRASTAV